MNKAERHAKKRQARAEHDSRKGFRRKDKPTRQSLDRFSRDAVAILAESFGKMIAKRLDEDPFCFLRDLPDLTPDGPDDMID